MCPMQTRHFPRDFLFFTLFHFGIYIYICIYNYKRFCSFFPSSSPPSFFPRSTFRSSLFFSLFLSSRPIYLCGFVASFEVSGDSASGVHRFMEFVREARAQDVFSSDTQGRGGEWRENNVRLATLSRLSLRR